MHSDHENTNMEADSNGFAFERQVLQSLHPKESNPTRSTQKKGDIKLQSSHESPPITETLNHIEVTSPLQIHLIPLHEEGRQLSEITDVSQESGHEISTQPKNKAKADAAPPNPKRSTFQRHHQKAKTELFLGGGRSPERNSFKQSSNRESSNRSDRTPSLGLVRSNSVEFNRLSQETESRSPSSRRTISPRKKTETSFRVPYSEIRKTIAIPLSLTKSSPNKSFSQDEMKSLNSLRESSPIAASPSRSKIAKSKLISSEDVDKLFEQLTSAQLRTLFPHLEIRVQTGPPRVKKPKQASPQEKMKNLEKEKLKKLPLKPFMNEKSNQHINAALIDRMASFVQKKKEEIEHLKKEIEPRKEEEIEFDLKTPSKPEKTPLLEIPLLEEKLIKEMTSPRQKPSVSKVSEKLSKKVIEKTSPNVLERFRLYQEKIEGNLRQKEKEAELQLKAQMAPKRKNSNCQKAQGVKSNCQADASNEKNEMKRKVESNLSSARTNSAKARVPSQSAGGRDGGIGDGNKNKANFTSPRNQLPIRETYGSVESAQGKKNPLSAQKHSSPTGPSEKIVTTQKHVETKTQSNSKQVQTQGKMNIVTAQPSSNGKENLKEGVEKIHLKIQKIQEGLEKLQFTFKTELQKNGEEYSSYLEQEGLSESILNSQNEIECEELKENDEEDDDEDEDNDRSLENSRISSYTSAGQPTEGDYENNLERRLKEPLKVPIAGQNGKFQTPMKTSGSVESTNIPQQSHSAKSSDKMKNSGSVAPKRPFTLDLSKTKFGSPTGPNLGNS